MSMQAQTRPPAFHVLVVDADPPIREAIADYLGEDDTFRFGADRNSSFQVLWQDGERVFCRRWRLDAEGNRSAVLAVLAATEHPTPSSLDRLAHEYGLKDTLDGTWTVRPLALVREQGRTMLVLEDPGGEPLA